MFSVNTSNLNVIFSSDLLKEFHVLREQGKLDVNGSSETSTDVSGACSNRTKVVVVGEACFLVDNGLCMSKSGEHSLDVTTVLHGDNSELIFFINPDQEGLSLVNEDTTSIRPISAESCSFKVLVSILEQVVFIDELFLSFFAHGVEVQVLTSNLTFELRESRDSEFFDFLTLFLGDLGSEREVSKVSSETDTSRTTVLVVQGFEVAFVHIPVGHVFVSRFVTMVIFDDQVQKGSEGSVRVGRTSVDSNRRIMINDTRVNEFLESVSMFILDVLELLVDLFSQVFGQE